MATGPANFIRIVAAALSICMFSFAGGYILFHGWHRTALTSAPIAAETSPDAPAAGATAPAVPPPVPVLHITKALYGDLPNGATADVTDVVARHVQDASLVIKASNDLFGDPVPGIVKKLRVDYTIDGAPGTRTVDENEVLRIVISERSLRLKIVKALYGDLPDGKMTDVTAKLTDAVINNALEIDATNENFGDPAPGIVKKLRVDYTLDGVARSQTVNEGETFTISNLPP